MVRISGWFRNLSADAVENRATRYETRVYSAGQTKTDQLVRCVLQGKKHDFCWVLLCNRHVPVYCLQTGGFGSFTG